MEFDRAEVKFDIAPDGTPLGVYYKESKDSNKLVEELNAARQPNSGGLYRQNPQEEKKAKAFVYRIHDQPDATKLSDLAKSGRDFRL